ncbi:PREDICTED: uncharacterized protein LOC109473176 [Branchiostoma belcheri]|uniref:Uncharacterized protein LOC109473176 n=1 Tax=Branchiostoma belcheri TaxID=7741 RepID=A0A6P4ZBZ9_BRABE|nr:PREDICTED: uncharacterized protein LOC109473176 [Branchiostoma belcheri]
MRRCDSSSSLAVGVVTQHPHSQSESAPRHDVILPAGWMKRKPRTRKTEVRAALDRYGVEDSGHRHLHKAVDMVLKTFPHLPFGRVREEVKVVLKNRRYEKRTRKARKAPPTTASSALRVTVTRPNGTLLASAEERSRQGEAVTLHVQELTEEGRQHPAFAQLDSVPGDITIDMSIFLIRIEKVQ